MILLTPFLIAICAGVSDLSDAKAALDFATKFEVLSREQAARLKLAEVDFSDEAAIRKSIPRFVTVNCLAAGQGINLYLSNTGICVHIESLNRTGWQ